jgi:hypothetical protein
MKGAEVMKRFGIAIASFSVLPCCHALLRKMNRDCFRVRYCFSKGPLFGAAFLVVPDFSFDILIGRI